MADLAISHSILSLPFRPVDVEAQIRSRRLIERGEADGRSNLPPADATVPSGTELEIVNDVRAERERLVNTLASHLRAQNDALAKLDTAMDIAKLRNDVEHTISRIGQGDIAWKGEIARLLRDAREARKEYDDFRIEHGIRRAARDPGNRFLAGSLLFLAIVVESALNGVFFAEGSEFGLAGGTVLALGISVVNVLVFGFCLGIGPARWQHHRSPVRRVLAWILLAFGLLLVVAANGFVAHYRDAFERLGETVHLDAVWAHLRADPFGLARLQSWLLFFLGLFFAGLGFWKGYRFDDPYPGYGRISRRWQQAEQLYLENRQQRLAETSAERDQAKQALDRTIEQLRGAALQREQILGARARIVQEFQAHERHLEEAANTLLAAYREANRRVRTAAPPRTFEVVFGFEDRAVERDEIRTLLTVRPARADPEKLIAELDGLRARVLDAYQKIVDLAPESV